MPRPFLLSLLYLLASPQLHAQQGASLLQQAGQELRQGQVDQAIEHLESLVATEPENARAWSLLGYAYHSKHDWEHAIPAHEKAASFTQTAANANYNLACAYALQGKPELAFEYLAKARTAGFQNWASLWGDADLKSLQADPRFLEFAPPPYDLNRPFAEEVVPRFAWHGEHANDQFGWVAADAGDVDGDGIHDVLTSAPFLITGSPPQVAGRLYLYSGRSGKEIRRHDGEALDLLGLAVAGVGDLNQDGHADYAAAAPRSRDPQRPGAVKVWSGADGKLLFTIRGEAPGDGFGREVEGIFDVDGDGIPELLIGSPAADSGRGMVTIHRGRDGKELLRLRGDAAGEQFGSSIAAGGSPGHRLLVVGAMQAGAQQQGAVSLYRFRPEQHDFKRFHRAVGGAANVNYGRFFASVIGDVDGDGQEDAYTVDFEAHGGDGQVRLLSGADGHELWHRDGLSKEGLGIGNALVGDANGDGLADVLTGAWTNSARAASGGRCYLLSGKDGQVLSMWTCNIPGATMGFDSTSLPDTDGDGRRDFLFTAAWTPVNGPKTGSVYLLSGPAFSSTGAGASDDSRVTE